jgi:hypothetical protein
MQMLFNDTQRINKDIASHLLRIVENGEFRPFLSLKISR